MIRGEQFYRYINGDILFDKSKQMMLVIYHELYKKKRIVFLKQPDERFPDAGIIEKSDDKRFKIRILIKSEMTADLPLGNYHAELSQSFKGDYKVKELSCFFELLETQTK